MLSTRCFSMDTSFKVIHFIFFWSMVILRTTDGGSVTWHEPPPVETTSADNIELTADSRQLLEGSTHVQLSWNFSLTPDLTLITVVLTLNSEDVATVVPSSGIAGATSGFKGRFNVTWISKRATLIIFNVTEDDDGEFGCKLNTFQGAENKIWERKMKVEVVDPAVITRISGNQTVNETDVVTLNCSAEGMPTPVPNNWTRVSDNSNVSFPLTITGKQDEGGYRCTADNGIGNPASQVVYIIVENYRPIDTNLSTSLSEKSVVVNTSFNITCSSEANPPAKYRFYRNQDNFHTDTTGSDVSVITTSVSERIKQVNYSCTPFNDFGDGMSDMLMLTVLYAPSSTNLITVPNNTTLLRESKISLDCSTDANPDAHIYHFYLNDNLISNSSSGVFNTTVMEDGVYTCVPINTFGTGDNATVSITVLDPPSITKNKISETVEEGDNITLTCNPTGKPRPVITWTKLGSSEVLSNTSSLTIVNVSRPGTPDNMIQYQCTASNGVGTPATATVNVTVHYAPSSTNLITVPNNTTLLRKSNISLDCSTDANPDVHIYHFYLNDNLTGNSSSGVFNTTVMEDGVYICVPINTVGTGENATVSITVVDPPSITIHKIRETVEEGDNITVTCNAFGKPRPVITWTKLGSSEVLSSTSLLTIVNVSRPGTPDNKIKYQCTASNGVGTPATDIAICTVHYAPEATTLTTVPSNRTVLRDSLMTLNCETDASPEAEYHFYFNGEFIGKNTTGVLSDTVEESGNYTCVPKNRVGTGDNFTVSITVVVPPSVEAFNETAIVVEGEGLVLTCNGSGKPEPVITWTKLGSSEVLSYTSSLTIVNVSRPGTPDNKIKYQCTASNGVGTPASATSTLDVHYAPSFIDPGNETHNQTLALGQEVILLCLGIGNPAPTVNWTSTDSDINWISNLTNVTFKAAASSSGSYMYLCTIKNRLGEDSKRFYLVLEGKEFLIKLNITNKDCGRNNPKEICEQAREMVEEKIEGEVTVTVENCGGCGSVTAYLSLVFTQSVKIPEVLSVLKKAAESNGFGELQVDPGSIQAISDVPLPTDSSTQTPSSTVGTTKSGDGKDEDKLWIIIGASAGGTVVLVVVVVVAWCVHHKRKCRRKGSKVRCSESEEQAFASREGNDHGHVNNGYAEAGPRPTAMVDMSQHQGASAAPTYAVVDKSAKKGNKKDKKVEEQKPQAEPPQYSVVDKSKKKKKEVPDATYAQVDMSKKSKKKPKPGEVLYADLGDFHQMRELPKVSTSPQALPPIKKPAPYVETQYADITQFLKGDATLPDSNNSQGPATGTQATPVPENSNSQEPGTSTKETSQASNPGGGGGPSHETNF